MTQQKTNRGFTIVELLIVIVVIAILATITIIGFNGVQNRAKTSTGQAAANSAVKKFEALNAIKGLYYTNSTAIGVTGALINTYAAGAPVAPEAVVETPTSVIVATSSAGAGLTAANSLNGTVVAAWACANGTGANVAYWNFGPTSPGPVVVKAGPGC